MNKLTLSCLKSLVEFRSKGDWKFLSQLVLIWPEARAYYWNKQGFRGLLGSWPFTSPRQDNTQTSFLWVPEGKVIHGFQTKSGLFRSTIVVYEQGERLLTLVYRTKEMAQWTCSAWQVWSSLPREPVLLPMNQEALLHLYKEFPMVKQKVLRALNLARDLGKTKIRALNELAALTYKA